MIFHYVIFIILLCLKKKIQLTFNIILTKDNPIYTHLFYDIVSINKIYARTKNNYTTQRHRVKKKKKMDL